MFSKLAKFKKSLIASTLLLLFPVVMGLVLRDFLPEQVPVHFNLQGQADRFGSPWELILLIPLIMLISQWVMVLITAAAPNVLEKNPKPFRMVIWIIPVIANVVCFITYAIALGVKWDVSRILLVAMAGMFLVLGNFMPKCRQNSSIGVRVPWTLKDEDTWNATHRLTGKLWVGGSLVMFLCCLLPGGWGISAYMVVVLLLAFVPMGYAWWYYRKKVKAGKAIASTLPPMGKAGLVICVVLTAAILVLVVVLMFTGDIQVSYGPESFTIQASFWQDMTVKYADIEAIEYRDGTVSGTRAFGFGSPRLGMGTFQNGEFGSYTRYTYGGADSAIVLTVRGQTLVLSGKDPEQTQAIYHTLLENTGR